MRFIFIAVIGAAVAVVLGSVPESTVTLQDADSCTLLVVLNIEAMSKNPDIFIIVDVIHTENMKFIGFGKVQKF